MCNTTYIISEIFKFWSYFKKMHLCFQAITKFIIMKIFWRFFWNIKIFIIKKIIVKTIFACMMQCL